MTQDDAIKIVESIGDVLGLEKIKDRMGISYYAESENTVVRISDHSTYCQTWVDKGTYKKTNKYSVVIEVNPSKPNPIINIPVSEFSIKEFKHKLKKLDNNSVMNITNAIKGAIGPGGQFSNPEQVIPKTIISKYIPPKPSISKTNNMKNNKLKTNNMKKNVIKLNENTLRQIVTESVKKVLKESLNTSKITEQAMQLLDTYGSFGEESSEQFMEDAMNVLYNFKAKAASIITKINSIANQYSNMDDDIEEPIANILSDIANI